MHGYELRKRLSTTLGPLYVVSFGSLYPCLKRLRRSGLVREEEAPARRRRKRSEPDESAATKVRRARRVYELTHTGETFFFDQLEQGAVYDTERFRLRFAFFRYLPRESRIGLMERRKIYLQEKLLEFKESLQTTKERIDSYTLTLIKHGMETTEQDIRWLEDLIAQERAGTLPGAGKGTEQDT